MSKFDGNNWFNYTFADGLIDSNFYCLSINENGILYAGGGSTVSYLEGDEWFMFENTHSSNTNRFSTVRDIDFSSDGAICIGSYYGLYIFNTDTSFFFSEETGIYDGDIKDIFIDDEQKIWLSTEDGIICFTPNEEEKQEESNSKRLNISPNPSPGQISIKLDNPEILNEINIYDIQGRLVMNKEVKNQQSVRVNMEGEAKGIYFIRVSNEFGLNTQKIILK